MSKLLFDNQEFKRNQGNVSVPGLEVPDKFL